MGVAKPSLLYIKKRVNLMVKVLCYGHKDTSSTLVRVYPNGYYNNGVPYLFLCLDNKYALKFVFVFCLAFFIFLDLVL